jgi:septal ring factor EnvC (AmiA/AmiB activator)
MKNLRKLLSLSLVLAFSAGALSLTSCTPHPNEEEIKVLEETRTAALSAEKETASKNDERVKLEAEVNALNQELEKLKTDKEKVLKRIAETKSAEAEESK